YLCSAAGFPETDVDSEVLPGTWHQSGGGRAIRRAGYRLSGHADWAVAANAAWPQKLGKGLARSHPAGVVPAAHDESGSGCPESTVPDRFVETGVPRCCASGSDSAG